MTDDSSAHAKVFIVAVLSISTSMVPSGVNVLPNYVNYIIKYYILVY